MNKTIKHYIIPIILSLGIGMSLGESYSIYFRIKDQEYSNDQVNALNKSMYGNGMTFYLKDSYENSIENIDDLNINSQSLSLNICIDNFTHNYNSNYTAVVLVDSKQVDFLDINNILTSSTTLNIKNPGKNIFKIKLDNIDNNINELTIILFDNSNSGIILRISNNSPSIDEYCDMQIKENPSISDGIYLNYKSLNNKLYSSDLIFSENKDELIVPFIFKCSDENMDFKLYMFDENYHQININEKTFLLLNSGNGCPQQGEINLKNISDEEKKYKLLAVPIDDDNCSYFFSKELTIIGE